MEEVAKTEMMASVGAPQDAASQIAALQSAAGGNGTVMVVLALLALVGGKTGWKFWTDWRKQKHEEAMKALELEAKVKLAEIGEEVSPVVEECSVEESPVEKPKKKAKAKPKAKPKKKVKKEESSEE